MTPPDANLERQKRRHGPVLWGIVGAAVHRWYRLERLHDLR
jgi:hypothetical protein